MARDGSTACVVVGGVLFTAAVMLALVRHPPLTRGGGSAPARVQRPATAAGQAPSSDPLDVALDRQAPHPPVVAPEATPAAGQKCEYGATTSPSPPHTSKVMRLQDVHAAVALSIQLSQSCNAMSRACDCCLCVVMLHACIGMHQSMQASLTAVRCMHLVALACRDCICWPWHQKLRVDRTLAPEGCGCIHLHEGS
jgi:hypothetical protein